MTIPLLCEGYRLIQSLRQLLMSAMLDKMAKIRPSLGESHKKINLSLNRHTLAVALDDPIITASQV